MRDGKVGFPLMYFAFSLAPKVSTDSNPSFPRILFQSLLAPFSFVWGFQRILICSEGRRKGPRADLALLLHRPGEGLFHHLRLRPVQTGRGYRSDRAVRSVPLLPWSQAMLGQAQVSGVWKGSSPPGHRLYTVLRHTEVRQLPGAPCGRLPFLPGPTDRGQRPGPQTYQVSDGRLPSGRRNRVESRPPQPDQRTPEPADPPLARNDDLKRSSKGFALQRQPHHHWH